MRYIAPSAELVALETVNVLLASVCTDDCQDFNPGCTLDTGAGELD